MALSIQRQWNAQIAYALQTGLGTVATGTGIILPLNTGHGEMTDGRDPPRCNSR